MTFVRLRLKADASKVTPYIHATGGKQFGRNISTPALSGRVGARKDLMAESRAFKQSVGES